MIIEPVVADVEPWLTHTVTGIITLALGTLVGLGVKHYLAFRKGMVDVQKDDDSREIAKANANQELLHKEQNQAIALLETCVESLEERFKLASAMTSAMQQQIYEGLLRENICRQIQTEQAAKIAAQDAEISTLKGRLSKLEGGAS